VKSQNSRSVDWTCVCAPGEVVGDLSARYRFSLFVSFSLFNLCEYCPVMIERVQRTLEEMAAPNLIEQVDQPTDWVSSMPVVSKPSNELT